MPKRYITLKLDFKITADNKLRIIDIGDGLSAGLGGFEDSPVAAKILHDLYEASGAVLATPFGELPQDAMYPETIHIPLVLRQAPPERALIDIEDLSEFECILPYCESTRLGSVI